MKKNEHYFPTVEWLRDPREECGWRRVTYEGGKLVEGESTEGVPPAAEDNGDIGEGAILVPEEAGEAAVAAAAAEAA
jgi:hypothetical protein